MAVNVDTVYQRVLAIANKEQRGYITPQEFNLFANQAQLDIFEQYFYDINQFGRLHGNDTEYSDMLDNLNEKIAPFENFQIVAAFNATTNNFDLPIDLYRLGTVLFTNNDTNIEVEQVQQNELLYINSSPLTSPTNRRPIYVRIAEFSIAVFPATISGNVFCNYINRPADVQWGYNVVNKKALYNAGTSVNFELHASEEQELVMKILELAGITIRQADLVQIAGQEDLQKIQQEKA